MNPSYSHLTKLNPHLTNKTEEKLNELINAINSCGYEWNESIQEFHNKELGKGIKTSGLDIFTPESFIETYNTAWSDPYWQGVHKYGPKFYKTFLLTVLVTIISFIFIKWEYALIVSGLFIAYTVYFYFRWQYFLKRRNKKKKEKEKQEGTYIDVSKIKWCLTCVHFKKVRKYEDELHLSLEMLPNNKIPCKIYNKTKELWEEYFNGNLDDRYLYPKTCERWEKK
jgi:hypothetical protein